MSSFEKRRYRKRQQFWNDPTLCVREVNCTHPNDRDRYPWGLLRQGTCDLLRLTVTDAVNAQSSAVYYGRKHHLRISTCRLSGTQIEARINPRPRR